MDTVKKPRVMGPPTDADLSVVAKLRELTRHGWSPSFAELAAAMGYKSRNSIRWHLDRAKEAGLVTWDPRRTRSFKVT